MQEGAEQSLTNDETLVETCYRFHNNGCGRRKTCDDFSHRNSGANLRMTEVQAALLIARMTRPRDAGARARRERRVSHEPAATG
jgi:dTDP-4-amino-4,6-dideoxygalactose transaminase